MRLEIHIGDLLAALETRQLAQNTLVLFVGDNGAAIIRGKGTLYERGLNVRPADDSQMSLL